MEHARCAGEVHDLREEDNTVKRAIPARVKRRVLDRDGRRCLVPGCRAMAALELHHEGGWKKGHDPEQMLTLCWAHHRARHDGLLRIEGKAPEFRFLLLDGTALGGDEAMQFSHGISSPGSEGDRDQPSARREATAGPVAGEVTVRQATFALRSLGMTAREATTCVQDALSSGGVRPWTVEDLIRSALQAS